MAQSLSTNLKPARISSTVLTRVILVRTGAKYDVWYENRIKHMIDTYSNIKYDSFHVIRDHVYNDEYKTFNKLLMFKYFKDDCQNIYFDLDTIIKGDCNRFLTEELHALKPSWNTLPMNSSILSWRGDYSHIHDKIHEDLDWYYTRFWKGIDEYLWKYFKPKLFENGFVSFQTEQEEKDYPVYLFNQRHEHMKEEGWWSKYVDI